MCDICDASDEPYEPTYEDPDRDYAEEEYNRWTDHEEGESDMSDEQSHQARMEQIQHELREIWPDAPEEPETDNPDDHIGIATFEADLPESDQYRRALQTAQLGFLI